ncbi:MAG: DUF4199 family protein [Proteobacteria bacterium]|nr:DUF4199 family protein [Pseudomonadota bacterium]
MRTILLPGLIAGLILGLLFIALNTLGPSLSYTVREVTSIIAMLLALFVAQWTAIARQPAALSGAFLPRYFTAVLCGVATATVYGLMTYLHFRVIDPQYLARFHEQYIERVRGQATTAEESEQLIAAAREMEEFVMNPLSQALVQFGTVLMLGLLAGVLVALLVRRAERS